MNKPKNYVASTRIEKKRYWIFTEENLITFIFNFCIIFFLFIFLGIVKLTSGWKREGYNVLFYGFGSKKKLMDTFAEEQLKNEIRVVIKGFFPALSLKNVSWTQCKPLSLSNKPIYNFFFHKDFTKNMYRSF